MCFTKLQDQAFLCGFLCHPQSNSWNQLASVAIVHAIHLIYLVVVRPYLETTLQWLEVLCHFSEMVIFLGAIASMIWVDVPAINFTMIGELPQMSMTSMGGDALHSPWITQQGSCSNTLPGWHTSSLKNGEQDVWELSQMCWGS